MSHSKIFEEQALLYAYGELEKSKEPAFLRHLETCKQCQSVIDTASIVKVSLEEFKAPPLNMRKVLGKPWWTAFIDLFKKVKLSRPVLIGAAAACCVAVLVSFIGLRQPAEEGYMYFSDSLYSQIGNVESDIDTLLEDIDSYL